MIEEIIKTNIVQQLLSLSAKTSLIVPDNCFENIYPETQSFQYPVIVYWIRKTGADNLLNIEEDLLYYNLQFNVHSHTPLRNNIIKDILKNHFLEYSDEYIINTSYVIDTSFYQYDLENEVTSLILKLTVHNEHE